MKCSRSSSSSKLERKTVEKNRRMLMKSLCFKLASLLPSRCSKRGDTVQDLVEKATVYIRMLQEKLQVLKEKRAVLAAAHNIGIDNDVSGGMMVGLGLPVIEVRDSSSAVEVVLITGSENKYFTLSDVITVIEEGGAQVVNASSSYEANKVFHIIHSQITSSRIGFDSARVHERLKEFINWS